jgi:hypothetical protein
MFIPVVKWPNVATLNRLAESSWKTMLLVPASAGRQLAAKSEAA